MNVLQINSVCGVGSTGRIAVELQALLEREGEESWIAYGRGEAGGPHTLRIGGAADLYAHVALTRALDRHGFGSRRATRRFLRQAEALAPDLIHLHNIHGYYLHIGELFAWLRDRGLPVVWTLHDCWAFTGHCAYFDDAGCGKWKTGCGHCPQKRGYPSSLWADRSHANFLDKQSLFTSLSNMTVVTPSEWLAGLAGESFLRRYPIRVIPNGIDRTVFRPVESDIRERLGIGGKRMVLGVASVWERRKGLKDFAALAERLGDGCQIVLVGVTERQRAALPSRILCLSRTDSVQELAALYTAADVFVNPSVEETMGMTTVEALACGTPAVVYDATALPETVDPSCGIAVPKGDIEALCQAVQAADFSREACLRRAARYDKDACFGEYTALYRRLVS